MSDQPDRPDDDTPDPLRALFEALMRGELPGQLPEGFTLPEGLTLPEGFTLSAAGLPGELPPELQALVGAVQQALTHGGDGPVNWDLARDLARQAAAEGGDPSVGEHGHRQVAEALRTADLWLDRVTDLPATSARTLAWSRAEWVENSLDTWKVVVEPIASSVADAIAGAMTSQLPEEARPMMSSALPMVRRIGGAFFGAQFGQALGALAREVVGGTDVGLPLLPAGGAALLPSNVADFGEGLGLPLDEVRLFLALREAAHGRLFTGVGWLRGHLLGAVAEYARGIAIDSDRIESAIREIDPTDPDALRDALASGLFEPERTPGQQAALDRLETALALVEGWVDEVVDAAARGVLPHASALRETIRRRRAVGGPAEHVFAALVGLELRPRRLREAANVWAAMARAHGISGRDALWAHPDLLPTQEALADPELFAACAGPAGAGSELDAALERLLSEEDAAAGPPPGDGPARPEDPAPGATSARPDDPVPGDDQPKPGPPQ